MGPHTMIVFADFGVYKAWQFFKYNVRRNPIFIKGDIYGHVKDLRGATFHDRSRSKLILNHKASVSNGLLVEETLFLRLRHLWAGIGSKKWDVFLSVDSHDLSRSQWPFTTRLVTLDREILSLRLAMTYMATHQINRVECGLFVRFPRS